MATLAICICLIDCLRRYYYTDFQVQRVSNLEILGNGVIFGNLRSLEKPTLHKVNQVDAISNNKLEEM